MKKSFRNAKWFLLIFLEGFVVGLSFSEMTMPHLVRLPKDGAITYVSFTAGIFVFDSTFSLLERVYYEHFQSIGDNGNQLNMYLYPTQSIMLPAP